MQVRKKKREKQTGNKISRSSKVQKTKEVKPEHKTNLSSNNDDETNNLQCKSKKKLVQVQPMVFSRAVWLAVELPGGSCCWC